MHTRGWVVAVFLGGALGVVGYLLHLRRSVQPLREAYPAGSDWAPARSR